MRVGLCDDDGVCMRVRARGRERLSLRVCLSVQARHTLVCWLIQRHTLVFWLIQRVWMCA
jgi:hypothetical protein